MRAHYAAFTRKPFFNTFHDRIQWLMENLGAWDEADRVWMNLPEVAERLPEQLKASTAGAAA